LNIIMGAMADTADDADRAALAVAAFGRSGQMMSILAKSYTELRAEARELGLVIDESLIRNAEKTNDQMTALAFIIKTQVTAGLLELAPYIQKIVTDLTEWVKVNKGVLSQDLPGYIKGVGNSVRSFVNSPAFEAFKEYWEIIAGAAIGMKVGGPLGALFGAAGGAGFSIYKDLSEYFKKTLPDQIREANEELAKLGGDLKTAPLYSTMFTRGKRDIKIRIAEVKEELAGYEKIMKVQQDIVDKAREKVKAERDAAAAMRAQTEEVARLTVALSGLTGDAVVFEIADVRETIGKIEAAMKNASLSSGSKQELQGELTVQQGYLAQLKGKRSREFAEWSDQAEKIMALDKEVQNSLELIHLDGYQKQLKALDQKQQKELEKYKAAGANIADLEKLHAAQRENATLELLPKFTDAPGFAGTGGSSGEAGMLEQQRDDLNKWYEEQKALLEQHRQARADLNAKWNEKERQIEEQHSTQLARIQQARALLILSSSANMFQSLADIQQAFGKEQSKTYKTLFAISKAFTIAETTLNMYNAISDAWATGATVADKIAAASMVAGGMLTIIQSAQAVGIAHDGIDSVPETGTWLLQKGERVVAERTSKKLDDTLSRLQSGGNMNVNIHEAPGTTAQVVRRADGLDIQIALIEERLTERMSRGTGMAGALDRRYGRRG